MSDLKFTIKKRGSTPNAQHPIYVEVHFSRQNRVLINTGVKSDLKNWSPKTRELRKSHPEFESASSKMRLVRSQTDEALLKLKLNNLTETKEELESLMAKANQTAQKAETRVVILFEAFIESKIGRVSKSVITDYKALKRHVEDFEKFRKKKLHTNELPKKSLYDEFFVYLTYHANSSDKDKPNGLMVNTVGKQIKNLKVLIRHLIDSGELPATNLKNWKVQQVDVDAVALNDEEIKKIAALNLSGNKAQDIIRDLFILGCETGLRFNNFSSISEEKVKGKHLELWDNKNKRRLVVPISPRVTELLKKYNQKLPTKVHVNDFNREIKLIAQQAGVDEIVTFYDRKGIDVTERSGPKHYFISSHTCRRSFCTNWFRKGMPVALIRRLSGHTTDKSFYKYIKISEDEAADLMLEWWEKLK